MLATETHQSQRLDSLMSDSSPTKVRFHVLGITTLVAFLMYLDRACIGWIINAESFQSMGLDSTQKDHIASAFFWAYALAQMPAGWLSDRYGARVLMTIYIASWSLCTAATSCSIGFMTLMIARLGTGLAEAGAYPASSSILTKWAHVEWRGLGSSIVSMGGRIGGALAPLLTAFVILRLGQWWPLESGEWRWAGWIYGVLGLLVAFAFWRVFREHPRQHPRCNEAEIALLAEGRGDFQPTRDPPKRFPWAAALRSRNLWLMNLYQFLANVGWVFMLNTLPKYLKEVMHVDDKTNGILSTLALAIAVIALPIGGIVTDVCTRKLGPTWGRRLPLSLTRFFAAGSYLAALAFDSPVMMAVAFGAVAFFADFALPATWATMQDISGKHQAQLFGWANMWGNFGAALQPAMLAWIAFHFDANHDYREAIWFSAGVFALAGIVALGLDAKRPVVAAH